MTKTILLILGIALGLLVIHTAAHSHSWYSGQRNPANGWSCCGGSDCVELEEQAVEETDGGWLVDIPVLNGKATISPDATIVRAFFPYEQASPSQNGKYHACYWSGKPRCFFIPLGY